MEQIAVDAWVSGVIVVLGMGCVVFALLFLLSRSSAQEWQAQAEQAIVRVERLAVEAADCAALRAKVMDELVAAKMELGEETERYCDLEDEISRIWNDVSLAIEQASTMASKRTEQKQANRRLRAKEGDDA